METLNDVLVKRYSKSLVTFMKLVDPERKFAFTDELKTSWDKLTLIEQQRLYLYLLYRKWRGISIYGSYTKDEARIWHMTEVTPLH